MITQTDLYQYRSYLETILTYGCEAADSHLTNGSWYLDTGGLLPCDKNKATNTGFIGRWTLVKQSKELQLLGMLHSDICNVIPYLLPGISYR